jgi:hypothetical protein
MPIGFIGYVMKNNVKVGEFPCTVITLVDGSQRVRYDVYDFIGLKGLARRTPKSLFIKKKTYPMTKVFRYSPEWDTLTEGGCISYWDQTSQAQIPVTTLKNKVEYDLVVASQKRASDVLYYCLQADVLITNLSTQLTEHSLVEFVMPSLLIGGIILTAIMNVYAASQYLQAWGVIKGTMGALGSLQQYFQNFAGVSGIIVPPLLPGLFLGKKKEEKKSKATVYDTVNVLIREKSLVTTQMLSDVYAEESQEEPPAEGTQAPPPTINYFIVLKAGKKAYKLYIDLGDAYVLKGLRTSTIFVQYKKNDPLPYQQLNLADMDIDSGKHPINEDMGKVLAKVYEDNLKLQKKDTTMIAGLTKILFYAFISSILVYVAMYGVNILFTYMALSAVQSATTAINHLASFSQYHIAPVGNALSNTISNTVSNTP